MPLNGGIMDQVTGPQKDWLQLVHNQFFWFLANQATGNCSPVAISCSPVHLPVFAPVSNWTLKHYIYSTPSFGDNSIKRKRWMASLLNQTILSPYNLCQIKHPTQWRTWKITCDHCCIPLEQGWHDLTVVGRYWYVVWGGKSCMAVMAMSLMMIRAGKSGSFSHCCSQWM